MKNVFSKKDKINYIEIYAISPSSIYNDNKDYIDIYIGKIGKQNKENTICISKKELVIFLNAIPKIIPIIDAGYFSIPCECGQSHCRLLFAIEFVDKKNLKLFIQNNEKDVKFLISLEQLNNLRPF